MAENQEYKAQKDDKIVKLEEVVNFNVSHSKDFKGTKHLKDGATISLHVDQAKYLEERGVGSIVKK